MSKKINDLTLAVNVQDNMQLETDIGGTTCNKIRATEVKNYVMSAASSAGWVSGGVITDNGDETVDVSSGTGYFRVTDDYDAYLKFGSWTNTSSLAISTDSKVYIYVDYNSGSPIVSVTDNIASIRDTEWSKFELAEIVNEGGALHISSHKQIAQDVNNLMQQRVYSIYRIQRANAEGGLILGETGTRNVSLSAGNVWIKMDKVSLDAVDTSGADTFDRYYRDGVGGWTIQTGQTQWDNVYYDDGSGTLAELTNNRYSVQYFWAEADNEGLVSIYGQNQYATLAAAENDTVPTDLPDRIGEHALLVGRIIFQKNDTTAQLVESAFTTTFATTASSNHSNLSNLSFDDSNHTGFQRATILNTVDPTVNEDVNDGYANGSLWLNTTSNDYFILLDNTAAAAVWEKANNWLLSAGTLYLRDAANVDLQTNNFTANNINATNDLQVGGVSINTANTLNNVAYLNYANQFSAIQSYNYAPSFTPGSNQIPSVTYVDSVNYFSRSSGVITTKYSGDHFNLEGGGEYRLAGTNINTTGTLSNIAYKGQDNIFSVRQSYNFSPTFNAGSDQIPNVKYVDDQVSAISYWSRVGTTLSPATAGDNINTTGDFQLNGASINSTGTLTNVAYKGQDNSFSVIQSYSSHPSFSADTDIVDKKYVDDQVGGVNEFSELTDVSGAYTRALALYRTKSTIDGLEETTTLLDEGSNSFTLTNGSTSLTVTASCGINQDLSTSGNPNFSSVTATGTVQGDNVNGTSSIQLNGTSINTTGTLSNVAYKGQNNSFTVMQTAPNFISTVAVGTQPYACTSTTVNTNLNADKVDGYDFNQSLQTTNSPAFVGLTLSGLADGLVKSTSGLLSGGNTVTLTSDVTGVLPIANGGTNSSTALNNSRVMISNGNSIVESTITTTNLGVLSGITSISTGTIDNDKIVTKGYVDDSISGGGTFAALTDVTGAYTTANALYAVNGTIDGLQETTTLLTQPSANQFILSRGTSDLAIQTSCTIDQDLSTASDVTFNQVTANKHYVGTHLLNADAEARHFVVGTHGSYSEIADAISAIGSSSITTPWQISLTSTYWSREIDFRSGAKGHTSLFGANTNITGRVSLFDLNSVYINRLNSSIGNCITMGTILTPGTYQYGFFNINRVEGSGDGVFTSDENGNGWLYGFANSVVADGCPVIGSNDSTSRIDQHSIYINKIDLDISSADSYVLKPKGTDSRSNLIANTIYTNSSATYTSTVFEATVDSSLYLLANEVKGFDEYITQNNASGASYGLINSASGLSTVTSGSAYSLSNKLTGDITVNGGTAYYSGSSVVGDISVSSGNLYGNFADLEGDITTSSGSGVTSNIFASYYSGAITRTNISELVGLFGRAGDVGIDCYTGTGFLNLYPRGASSSGGGIELKGAGSNDNWRIYPYNRDLRIRCEVDSSLYDMRIYNAFTGRTSKLYVDSLDTTDGTVYASSGYLTRTNPSDERLKENIKKVDTNGLCEKLLNVPVKTFNMKLSGNESMGVIAQELMAEFPDAVTEEEMPISIKDTDEDGQIVYNYDVRYGVNDRIKWYHLAATQELINRVKILEDKLSKLI